MSKHRKRTAHLQRRTEATLQVLGAGVTEEQARDLADRALVGIFRSLGWSEEEIAEAMAAPIPATWPEPKRSAAELDAESERLIDELRR